MAEKLKSTPAVGPDKELEFSGGLIALLLIETYAPDALEKANRIRWRLMNLRAG
jgi:hypothetical protein